MINCKALIFAIVALGASTAAFAHHSFAMFDADKTVELKGTVKEFQWTNPHSWLQLLVTNSAGAPEEWSLEMGGPDSLSRYGWRPRTMAPGDKVSITIHPLKDGTRGGQLVGATLADGKVLGVSKGGGQ